MKKEIISFSDVLDVIFKYDKKEISNKDFQEWIKKNIKVNTYIDSTTKYLTIKKIASNIQMEMQSLEDEDIGYVYLSYNMYLLFNVLFQYTNVEIAYQDINTDNYDIVMASPIYDFIISKCERDYNDFVKLADRTTAINNISLIKELGVVFYAEPNVENYTEVKKLIDSMDVDKLKILESVRMYNDPLMGNIVDMARKAAQQEILESSDSNG